ncbi:MAG TPA: host attachment family protein [Methylocystis sp.]|nr:host attachment family protein [Methylocystis sp.]
MLRFATLDIHHARNQINTVVAEKEKEREMTHIVLHNGAWVLVGDGRHALFLYNHGDPDLIDLRVIEARVEENPPTHEQGTDAPGRLFGSRSGPRSAVEPTDWHEHEKEHFAREIAARINKAAQSGEMKEIVIIAPPRALGEIRKELSPQAAARVKGEIDRDLARHPLPEIEKALARQFAAF